eukprot:g44607.t1
MTLQVTQFQNMLIFIYSQKDIATMQLCANKLDKKDFFGKSDPFLVFYRSNEDGTAVRGVDSSLFKYVPNCRFTICHKTEVVKNTLNPVWQPFTIPVRALCNGDYDSQNPMLPFLGRPFKSQINDASGKAFLGSKTSGGRCPRDQQMVFTSTTRRTMAAFGRATSLKSQDYGTTQTRGRTVKVDVYDWDRDGREQ